MYSGLKNLSIVLLVISIVYGSISIFLVDAILSNYKLFNSSSRPIAVTCIFLIVTVQIILISLTAFTKKLIVLLTYKESTMIERITFLENKR